MFCKDQNYLMRKKKNTPHFYYLFIYTYLDIDRRKEHTGNKDKLKIQVYFVIHENLLLKVPCIKYRQLPPYSSAKEINFPHKTCPKEKLKIKNSKPDHQK